MSDDGQNTTGAVPPSDDTFDQVSNSDYFNSSLSASTSSRPEIMQVGTGSLSREANNLVSRLDIDSGYGSIADNESAAGWNPGFGRGQFLSDGAATPDSSDGRRAASHVHQLYYNQNRNALGRAITRTMEALRGLQSMNMTWPAHYPSVRRTEEARESYVERCQRWRGACFICRLLGPGTGTDHELDGCRSSRKGGFFRAKSQIQRVNTNSS